MKLVKAMIGSTDLDANALGTEEAGGPVLLVLIGLLGMRLVMLDPYHLLILGRKYYTPYSIDVGSTGYVRKNSFVASTSLGTVTGT